MRATLMVLCLLAATACDETSPAAPTVGLNERFTLSPGQAATIKNADLRLEFIDVSGDSRCPGDAICIQGGDALVRVRVANGASSSSYDLHTGDSSRAAIVHEGVRIALLELQPYPFGSLPPIGPGDYRATFTASRQ